MSELSSASIVQCQVTPTVRCDHCGAFVINPTPSAKNFCCRGCEFVHATLQRFKLTGYYDLVPRDDSPVPREGSSPLKQYQYLDTDEVNHSYAHRISNTSSRVRFYLSGIHCAACIWVLEKLPLIVPGVSDATVQFASGQIEITYDPSRLTLSQIAYVLNSLGYPPVPMTHDDIQAEEKRHDRHMLYRIGVAAVCAANTMMLAVSLFQGFYTGIEEPYASFLRWTSAVIAAPAVFYSAIPFYRSALGSLISGSLHIDLPIATAIIATYLSGIITTVQGDEFVYFDSVTTLIFLLLVGRWMQRRAISRARATAMTPWDLLPTTVRVVVDGGIVEKDLRALKVDDIVEVNSWDRVPADGVVVAGHSTIDQSFLTGESLPVEVTKDSKILGGCINLDSRLQVKVSTIGSETRLGKILSDIERSQNLRTPAEDSANKLSGYFVVGVFLLAIITYAGWSFIDPSRAFDTTVALLIVTCPCALGLAIPAAVTTSLGRAKKRGIFIRKPDAFELLSEAQHFYFDKTGTLTSGKITVIESVGIDTHIASIVKALASAAPMHPISQAILTFCDQAKSINLAAAKHFPGRGIEGKLHSGEIVRLGSFRWFTLDAILISPELIDQIQQWETKGFSISALSINGRVIGVFALADSIAPGAKGLVEYLHSQKKQVFIISGDSQGAVNVVASSLGIPASRARGELFPEQKTAIVRGDSVRNCMVGDGLNDAPAMRESDVSIGLRGGIEATIEVASLYISSGKLGDVLDLLVASLRTKRLIHQNLRYSVIYNVIGGAAAIAGMINPLTAAILMPLSSLTTIGYSLLVKTFKT